MLSPEPADVTRSGRDILVLDGDLDLPQVGDLRRKLMTAIKTANETLLVDLSHVSFLGPSCVGALLFANRVAVIHNCELILLAPSPACREALEGRGVSVLFTTAP